MTQYAVCPRCHDLHPVGPTISESGKAVYDLIRQHFPHGQRINFQALERKAPISASAAYYQATRLADAGALERLPAGKRKSWYRLPVTHTADPEGADRAAREAQESKGESCEILSDSRTKLVNLEATRMV